MLAPLLHVTGRMTRRAGLLVALSGAVASLALSSPGAFARPNPASVLLPGYPLHHQQHELTCEAAATSMATKGLITEDQIIARTPENVDPNLGYRGNPNGPYFIAGLPNYGVYPDPLARVLASFGWRSIPVRHATRYGLERYLSYGWPVVVWITYLLQRERPYWLRQGGHLFPMVPWEHAVTAVGYDARDIIVNDPASGLRLAYDWHDFMRSWSYLGHMALAVQPCRAPRPVENIRSTRSTWTIEWTWNAEPGAAKYEVSIYKRLDHRWFRIKRLLTARPEFVSRGSLESKPYLIGLRALAACGLGSASSFGYSARAVPAS